MYDNVVAIILGGGRGTRLFPLTHQRAKPAVPIGGKYRLIDIPISNCLHADLRRIFVLTQFNSASLNRHVGRTFRMDLFSEGFVEILAAELTPDNQNWYQGTADAVRRAMRHMARHETDHYLILAGDHLYRMDYLDLLDAHVDRRADVTIAAQPVSIEDASSMGIFRFDSSGRIVGFEEKPDRARLLEIGHSAPTGSPFANLTPDRPFMASMGIYVFSRRVLLETLDRYEGVDFGREIIPAALGRYRVNAYPFRGYWVDVGTIPSFYQANVQLTQSGAPFKFYDPRRPIYTHPRFLPGTRFLDCTVKQSIVTEGCDLQQATLERSVIGIRSHVRRGSTIRRSIVLGADYYEIDTSSRAAGKVPRLGIGRNVVLDRVIVDKNARIGDDVRLTNKAGHDEADGDNYYIRGGIIIVPRDGIIPSGTIV